MAESKRTFSSSILVTAKETPQKKRQSDLSNNSSAKKKESQVESKIIATKQASPFEDTWDADTPLDRKNYCQSLLAPNAVTANVKAPSSNMQHHHHIAFKKEIAAMGETKVENSKMSRPLPVVTLKKQPALKPGIKVVPSSDAFEEAW